VSYLWKVANFSHQDVFGVSVRCNSIEIVPRSPATDNQSLPVIMRHLFCDKNLGVLTKHWFVTD